MVNNMYTRAGEAFGAGAPVGAAWNVGQITSTGTQSAWFGQRMAAPERAPLPVQESPWAKQGQAIESGAMTALGWLNTPMRLTGDAIEASTRYYAKNRSPIGFAQQGALGFLFGLTQQGWRDEFVAAQQAQSSPGQTAWLFAKAAVAPDSQVSRRDPFAMLDAEDRTERDEYFGSGVARWTTGVVDFAANIFLDPLVIGGKAAGVTRAARNTIKATDVAAAARGADNLTRGGQRVQRLVDSLADAFEKAPNEPGSFGALSRSRLIESTDSGAIVATMRSIDRISDPAARLAARKEALYAGMGHRPSLQALSARDKYLALELESFTSMDRSTAIDFLLHNTDEIDLDHLGRLEAVHADDYLDRVVAAHADDIRMERDAFQRLGAVGNPSGADLATTTGVGSWNQLPDFIHVGRTIHKGLGLPPVNVLFGRKLPNMVNLDADDAYDSFAAAVTRTAGSRVRQKATLDDEMKSLLDDFAATRGVTDPAAARAQRRAVVDRFNKVATDRLVTRHGGTPVRDDQVRTLVREIRTRREAEMLHFQSRVQRAQAANSDEVHVLDDIHSVATMRTVDAQAMVGTPFAGTQFDHMVSIPDYSQVEHVLKTRFADGFEGFMRRRADQTWEFTNEGLTVLSDLWKFGALFRPGYPIRNQVDTQLRNLAMVESLDLVKDAVKGAGHTILNRKTILRADADRLQTIANGRMRIRQIEEMLAQKADDTAATAVQATKLRDEMADILSKVETAEKALWTGSRESTLLSRRLAATRKELSDLGPKRKMDAATRIRAAQLKAHIRDMQRGEKSMRVRLGDTPLAHHIGVGESEKAAFISADEFRRWQSTSGVKESIAGLVQAENSRLLRNLRASGQWQMVGPSNPKYRQAYLDLVNNRVRNDAGLVKILSGATDDTLRKYYRADPEGNAIWKGVQSRYSSLDEFIAVQRQQVDMIVPEGPIRSMVLGGPMSDGMLDDVLKKGAEPWIPAEMLEEAPLNALHSAVNRYERGVSWWFKYAGEIPETMLGRLPFYISRKEMHLSRMWPKAADGVTDAKLTLRQLEELRLQADILARRDVGRYLFDTAQRSNLSAHMRFFSPFYSAWSDTMRKWLRISGVHPEAPPLLVKLFMAPNSVTTVVDDDGNRIAVDGRVIDADGNVVRTSSNPTEGNMVIPLPPGWGEWFGGDDKLLLSKTALNVTFQGEPFWLPSLGPVATIPANEVIRDSFPEHASDPWAKYLLPLGPEPDSSDLALPTWVKNAWTTIRQDHGDSRFAHAYAQIYAAKVGEIDRGEAEHMSQRELREYADNAARNWWIVRFMSNYMGATLMPQSRVDFYIKEYRRYRREYGPDADTKFLQDYPDYAEARISLSVNETGITATDETMPTARQYAADIDANPKFGWMYVGAANMVPGFSEGVYAYQQSQGWRTTKDPVEAHRDTRVSEGWSYYMQLADAIQQQLETRSAAGGSASLNARANQDLASARQRAVAALKADNPEWADAFERGGSTTALNEFFRAAATAVEDNPELAERGDFVTLSQYLQLRALIRQRLDERGLATVESPGAEDIEEVWAAATTALVASDLGFEQMWMRAGLDRDVVGRG